MILAGKVNHISFALKGYQLLKIFVKVVFVDFVVQLMLKRMENKQVRFARGNGFFFLQSSQSVLSFLSFLKSFSAHSRFAVFGKKRCLAERATDQEWNLE